MKCDLVFIVVSVVLLVVMFSGVVPSIQRRGFFTKEIVNDPPAEYVLNYMPTPRWWPH